MKCTKIRTLLVIVLLANTLTACGNRAEQSTTPAAPQSTAADVTEYSSVSNGANARGYGNQSVTFFFVLAYLFAPAFL